MEYDTFKQTLKENGLTLKAFSELAGVKYDTCSKWGKDGRPVSDWVASWLKIYIENKECRELKQILKDTVCKENV
jgi:predicted transcriptional regulator